MKLKKFAICFVAFMVTFAVSVTVIPESFVNAVTVSAATYLKKNSSGAQVKALQNDLIALKYMSAGSATGKFDKKTEDAVKKVQSNYGLTSDGIAGPDTLGLIEGLIKGTARVVQITGSTVNVRSNAGASYKKVTTVKKGQKYTYASTKTVKGVKWYKIKVKNKVGYISGSYVKVLSFSSATTTKTTTSSNKTTTGSNNSGTIALGTLKITGSKVNVRSGAGTSYGVVAQVKKGQTYSYTKEKTVSGKKWYYIKVSSSKSGWIIGTYVKATPNKTTTTSASTTTTVTQADSSTTATSVTSASTTTTVTQADSSTTTSVTSATEGSTTTITTTTTTKKPDGATRKVLVGTVSTQKSSSKLNVRKSANTSSSVIGQLKNGAKVVIIEKGSTWHKIEYGSGYGYVSAQFIKNINTTYQAISLNYSTSYNYVDKGKTIDMGFKINGADISYSSSDSKNCPISSKGVVTGKTEGLYEITAKSGSVSASTCIVVLRAPYTDIKAMKISKNGTDFIAKWEGGGTVIETGDTVYYPYQDVSGYWTIGYGHAKTSTASKSWSEERAISEFNKDIEAMIGKDYLLTDEKPYLTKEGAAKLLNADLNDGTYVKAVSNWAIRNGVKLTQCQFDALVSFCYNLGPAYWTSDSNKFFLKSAIISHRSGSDAKSDQIIEGFCRYIKSGGKSYKGLWYRRRNEAEMFIDGDYEIDRSNKFTPPSNISWA